VLGLLPGADDAILDLLEAVTSRQLANLLIQVHPKIPQKRKNRRITTTTMFV
jgi:hypothetical protein